MVSRDHAETQEEYKYTAETFCYWVASPGPKSLGLGSVGHPKGGPSWIMQGLGECLPQERLHFRAVEGVTVLHSRPEEVRHGSLTAQLLLISLLTTDSIKREEGSLLFQIVSLNLKNQEISLQS